jgi:hypothetical protein
VCPIDGQPLHSTDISDFSPNFGLLKIVAALYRNVAEMYRLPAGRIVFDTDEASFLGEGGNGRVYFGARSWSAVIHSENGPFVQTMVSCDSSHNPRLFRALSPYKFHTFGDVPSHGPPPPPTASLKMRFLLIVKPMKTKLKNWLVLSRFWQFRRKFGLTTVGYDCGIWVRAACIFCVIVGCLISATGWWVVGG